MNNNIKLFVTCHKKFEIPQCELLYPVQANAGINKKIEGYLYDDSGDNISHKNFKYCELSVQYYAWKNEEADYYGFMHYRRYFSFVDQKVKTNGLKEIVAKDFKNGFVEKYGYTKENIENYVKDYDIILPYPQFLGNVHFQYRYACTQDIKDLDFCTDYIRKKYPEMKKAVKKYLRRVNGYCCNMFIMKKDIFMQYSQWLFDVLDAHEKFNDHTHADVQTYRVSGYLAERLLGIYITYLKMTQDVKIKETHKIAIQNPNICSEMKPCENCKKTVVVPFDKYSFSDASVLVESIVENNKEETEIVLWHTKLEAEIVDNIKKQCKQNPKIFVKEAQIPSGVRTYSQLLKSVPKVFKNYDNIILIKPNSMCRKEIELRESDKAVCGVVDVDLVVAACKKKKIFKRFKKNNINPYEVLSENYLQINVQKFAKNIEKLSSECNFVDILSSNNDDIQVLPQKTMFKFDSLFMKSNQINSYAPHYLFREYAAAKGDAALVSFEGYYPPKKAFVANYSAEYFMYARKTPYYESLVYNLHKKRFTREEKKYKRGRDFLNKHFPQGTAKRLFLRTISKRYY